jgi:hypothetical protein
MIWGFRGRADRENTDAYDLLEDAWVSNPLNLKQHFSFRTDVHYISSDGVNGQRFTITNKEWEIEQGYLFGGSLQGLFGIPGRNRKDEFFRAEASWPIQRNELEFYVSCTTSVQRTATNGTYFAFPAVLTLPVVGSSQVESGCLSRVVIYSSRVDSISAFSEGPLTYDLGVRNVPVANCDGRSAIVEIRDAFEPLPLDIPGVASGWVSFLALALLVIGLVGLLFFIWHCWSVRYVIIKKVIWDSGVHFGR